MYELYLAHHGILGMKWGLRRYQNKDGSLTPSGKNRYSGEGSPRHSSSDASKKAKQRAAALEKARATRAKNVQLNADKKKALTDGDIKDIAKVKDHLTNKELSDALNRIQERKLLEQKLSELNPPTISKGQKIANGILKFAKDHKSQIIPAIKSVYKFLDEQDEKEKNNRNKNIQKEKASSLNKALAKGLISPDDYKKLVENSAVDANTAKAYAKRLIDTDEKKKRKADK